MDVPGRLQLFLHGMVVWAIGELLDCALCVALSLSSLLSWLGRLHSLGTGLQCRYCLCSWFVSSAFVVANLGIFFSEHLQHHRHVGTAFIVHPSSDTIADSKWWGVEHYTALLFPGCATAEIASSSANLSSATECVVGSLWSTTYADLCADYHRHDVCVPTFRFWTRKQHPWLANSTLVDRGFDDRTGFTVG